VSWALTRASLSRTSSLDAGKARITIEGVQEAMAHLQRFTGGSPLEAPERALVGNE
jgi:hypothetical protein